MSNGIHDIATMAQVPIHRLPKSLYRVLALNIAASRPNPYAA
jgi:hypothetical protein